MLAIAAAGKEEKLVAMMGAWQRIFKPVYPPEMMN